MILSEVVSQLCKPIPPIGTYLVPINFSNNIVLRDLYFKYRGSIPNVLSNISLDIPKGSRIGFIGETGSGKSTLLDIVMGLLSPFSGDLIIDGVIIDQKNIRNWQSNIAHVPQSVFLSDASIAENIAFGVPACEIDMLRVKQSAKQAFIDKFIKELPDGYQTHVGERGVQLSGGQRQRIAIARALYKRANVIVFDEATSALDNATEMSVMQEVDLLGEDLTVLIIAHRLSTLSGCDKIYKLDKGFIIDSGSYCEIIEK